MLAIGVERINRGHGPSGAVRLDKARRCRLIGKRASIRLKALFLVVSQFEISAFFFL
jgi:hypothetical protein